MTEVEKKSSTVPLNWKEVYYTNCPLVFASNVVQVPHQGRVVLLHSSAAIKRFADEVRETLES